MVRSIESDLLQDAKVHCLQACVRGFVCVFLAPKV